MRSRLTIDVGSLYLLRESSTSNKRFRFIGQIIDFLDCDDANWRRLYTGLITVKNVSTLVPSNASEESCPMFLAESTLKSIYDTESNIDTGDVVDLRGHFVSVQIKGVEQVVCEVLHLKVLNLKELKAISTFLASPLGHELTH